MKIKVEWKQEVEGVSEIEVPEAEVLAWLNDPVTGGSQAGTWTLEQVTPKIALEWLESGDEEAWRPQIDPEFDAKAMPWCDIELEGLAP